MNTYAAIALGAAGLAVLCVIAYALRRVMHDGAPLPFFRMLARRGLDATQLEGAVGARQLALAVRRCALCSGVEECEHWLAGGQSDPAAFCPNHTYLENLEREKRRATAKR